VKHPRPQTGKQTLGISQA
jgi:regulator of replication initiation timing